MTSNLQDVSLYELALASERPPHPLKVSPTTFKSMVETAIEVLIHHDLPATVWVKLPRGQVWQSAINRYCKIATTAPDIYVIKNKSELAETETLNSAPDPAAAAGRPINTAGDSSASTSHHGSETLLRMDHTSVIADDDEDEEESPEEPLALNAAATVLPLAPDSRLRREYFVLILTENFHALILAHRPRSARQLQAERSGRSHGGSLNQDDGDRKHPLLGICSFDTRTIQQVMGGIHQAISLAQTRLGSTPAIDSVLNQWDTLAHQADDSSLNPIILGSFWMLQIQQHEALWHSSMGARKQAEASSELQLENEELLNALRLKDEFLKNVGQELRTPLSTMKTALSLLSSPNLRPTQRQRYMDLLSQECDRQSSLITSVLELVQLENVEEQTVLQPLRLVDVVPGVVSTYQPLAQEKGILLAYTIPEDLPAVSCLSSWLRQIVINLLHNGIKFTPEGGQVWVRARLQGDYVQIEFRDTGIGVPATDIPKIFNRFYRIRQPIGEDSSGAGLGLSIVQQLLLRCGGSISVKSKPGEGSTFNVMLPIYHRDR